MLRTLKKKMKKMKKVMKKGRRRGGEEEIAMGRDSRILALRNPLRRQRLAIEGGGIETANPLNGFEIELVERLGLRGGGGAADGADGADDGAAALAQRKENMQRLVVNFRLSFGAFALAQRSAERKAGRKAALKLQQELRKKLKKERKLRKPPVTAAHWLGYFRRFLLSFAILLHPLVANDAFKSVHCIFDPAGAGSAEGLPWIEKWVVASAPTVGCFDPAGHLFVYVLGVVATAVSLVGLPIYIFAVLARSAGWRQRCRIAPARAQAEEAGAGASAEERETAGGARGAEAARNSPGGDDARAGAGDEGGGGSGEALADGGDAGSGGDGGEAQQQAEDGTLAAGKGETRDPSKGPGAISTGLCCCVPSSTHAYRDLLVETRAAVEATHSATEFPTTHNAWLPFTRGDYKPEFFAMRLVFVISITAIAFANTFLNPDYMYDPDLWTPGLLAAAQICRFVVCGVAVTVPCALLVALLPMKLSSRWKLPLRIACALVSLTMLMFNIAAWWVERAAAEQKRSAINIEWFGYIVVAMSIALLLFMAVLFVVFVVFRGAQLQKAREDAETDRDAAAAERTLIVALAAYLARCKEKRIVSAWRAAVVAVRPAPGVVRHLRPSLAASLVVPPSFAGFESDADIDAAAEVGEMDDERGGTADVATRFRDALEALDIVDTAMEVQATDAATVRTGFALGSPVYSLSSDAASGDVERESSEREKEEKEETAADEDETHSTAAAASKKRKTKRIVRWPWTPRPDVSLADQLFKSSEGVNDVSIPTYMVHLFNKIFAVADRSRDGVLQTIELTTMLQMRATGTPLHGNAHAIFSLNMLLTQQVVGEAAALAGDGGRMTVKRFSLDRRGSETDEVDVGESEFARGVAKAILRDPNGPVAEWILKEIQIEAAEWSTHCTVPDCRPYWRHDTDGATVWREPEIIAALRSCALACGAEFGGEHGVSSEKRCGSGSTSICIDL